jgi:DNA modification methylase
MIQAQEIEIKKLTPNKGQIEGVPTNPRKATKEQIDKLKKSIEETPTMLQLREIIAYDNNGQLVIVGGNMRYQALKALGHKTALVKVLPADTPKETINAFIIKDNAQFGEWDIDLLANEWDKDLLDDWGVEIDWAVEAPEQPKEAEEDDFSEEEAQQAPAIVKKGEIWQLGEHRLMCGDSTDAGSVSLLMDGQKADITFSSPPYNMLQGGLDKALQSEKLTKTYDVINGTYLEYADNSSDEEYATLLKESLKNGLSNSDDVLFNIGILAGSKYGIIEMMSAFRDKFCDIIVWNKSNSIPLGLKSNAGCVSHRCELIFCFNQNGSRSFSHPQWKDCKFNGEMMINRIDSKNSTENEYAKIHHATFPVEFAAQVIERFSKNSVLELFGGTGTTLVACEQLNRKCYLMELDPHYCDVIIARWEKLTGKKAERITHA